MAELQPPEGHINGGAGALLATSGDTVVGVGPTKRQRRPSVRLGDIGGDQQTYDSHVNRRTKQQWKRLPVKDSNKGSKTRPLMNLTSDYHETLDGSEDKEAGNHVDGVAIGSWKVRDSSNKTKRGSATKRVRSNWASNSKIEDGGGDGEEKFSGGDDEIDDDDDDDEEEDGYRERDFDRDGSDSPLKDPSPIHSLDNMNMVGIDADRGHRRDVRVRVSDGPSDTDARNWNNNQERNGVRVWLNQLGLGRYAPVFEIHEVDDEVLPLLTLEDLKDMGINAVGSRRKMYSSIQKLGKGFS